MEPHSLVGGMGEGSWSNWGLACGLQDQRLMARPPARAGGRSGLLTGGESGKPNGYFLPSPKGHLPTSPARPAGGRAGDVRGYPLGKRQRVTVRVPAFSYRQQTTSPARPSWWAGHEALVLEAAGQAHTDPTTFPRSSRQRMGFQGEGTSFPLVFFPLFLQRNRAPPGRAPFPPVPTAWRKNPTTPSTCTPQPQPKQLN